jgi:hypothetical protein
MQTGMLDTADITESTFHPVGGIPPSEREPSCVPGGGVPQKIPEEHMKVSMVVPLAPGGDHASFRTGWCSPQESVTVRGTPSPLLEAAPPWESSTGDDFLRDGNDATVVAVDHRNGSPPEALPRNDPVSDTEVSLPGRRPLIPLPRRPMRGIACLRGYSVERP